MQDVCLPFIIDISCHAVAGLYFANIVHRTGDGVSSTPSTRWRQSASTRNLSAWGS